MKEEKQTIHTKRSGSAGVLSLLVTTLAFASAAQAAVTPGQKCEAGKNDAAGKYASCAAKAEKGFVTGGDAMKYAAALAKCDDKYGSSWGKLEQKAVDAGSACPSTGDEAAIQDFVDACTQAVAEAVGGGTLPLDVGTCNTDLATCDGDLSTCDGDLSTAQADLVTCEGDLSTCESKVGVSKTGQTTDYGAGSDGDLERGVARSFTDNGDGTITDDVSGLMWEKKSDDGSIHDKDNQYTWGQIAPPYSMNGTMVTTFLAGLNGGGGFAGHTDWRIPNIHELESLRNLETNNPAVVPEFNDSCLPGCTVTTCSCTRSDVHWSSSTVAGFENSAWSVVYYYAYTYFFTKSDAYSVRAVRGGS